VAAVDRGVHAGLDAFDSSGEEYASGDLDNSSSDGGSSWHEGRPRHVDAWVSPGRNVLTERLLFAFTVLCFYFATYNTLFNSLLTIEMQHISITLV
jgi:hypothetical protein